ncbi:MAG: NADH-quinone oxidoreductase subunit D, partial [Burkholderiaceae bacterium]
MLLPPSHHRANQSFYHLVQVPLTGHACQGLACFAARNNAPERWQQAHARTPPLFCLGKCYQGPAIAYEDSRPVVEVVSRHAVLLANVVQGGVRDLSTYEEHGGGQALRRALTMSSAALIGMIADSGLRGRGGAGFPTGRKWAAVAASTASRKYVVANADEGDPGAFSDRMLMEDDPFRLIEAMVIASLTVGAEHAVIYLRKEYTQAKAVLESALL